MQRSLYAEQRQEIWFQDGRRRDDIIRITRLANRSFLAFHPVNASNDPTAHTGGSFFYLVDTEAKLQYNGDTNLGRAWVQYFESSTPGTNPMVDQYGECSVLDDASVKKVPAGKVESFAVVRIDRLDGNELYSHWIAPELGCFPLRSQVLVDGLVRLRVDTIRLELLPPETRLSLPKGIRVISPQAYCDLFRKRYHHDLMPQAVCTRYQKLYEERSTDKRAAPRSSRTP